MSITVCRNRDDIPPGFYLTDCAVSGGTLEAFLKTALELSAGKLCLQLRPMAMEFTLPCRSGVGIPITQQRLTQLRKTCHSHFSPALLMEYLTFQENAQVHLVLFDTEATLKKKQLLAERLGVPMILQSKIPPAV